MHSHSPNRTDRWAVQAAWDSTRWSRPLGPPERRAGANDVPSHRSGTAAPHSSSTVAITSIW